MGVRQVIYMDIVADASAIRSWIIRSKNFHGLALAAYGFKGNWDQVGLRGVQFADGSIFVGSGSVEVTETYVAESVGTSVGLKRIFKCQFCGPIGIDRVANRVLRDG